MKIFSTKAYLDNEVPVKFWKIGTGFPLAEPRRFVKGESSISPTQSAIPPLINYYSSALFENAAANLSTISLHVDLYVVD